jgi:hypothetical protein
MPIKSTFHTTHVAVYYATHGASSRATYYVTHVATSRAIYDDTYALHRE